MGIIAKLVRFAYNHSVWVALVGGVIVGLLVGLGIGYAFPLPWTNATPLHLRLDFGDDYLAWVANQYSQTGDVEWARQKLLGADYQNPERQSAVNEMLGVYQQKLPALADARGGEEAIRLRALAQIMPSPSSQPSTLTRLRPVLLVCGVGLLVVLLGLAVVYLISRRRAPRSAAPGRAVGMARFPAEEVSWGAVGPPVAQFPTTYALGDDHYDPSFSIELENGEFMGECGVGVSETIGVGTPSKVTAFEVWLFDKSDIRTVTRVLMSDYAYHDEALRTKLAPKGEPMMIEAGQEAVLETKTLRVRARIVEAEYGMGNLPSNSFFERLTIDLAAWVKPEQEGVPAMTGASPV
jgi:hypothetical protein